MSVALPTIVSLEEFERSSFDGVAELIRGKVVEMPPAGGVHGFVCSTLNFALAHWARDHDDFEVLGNDAALVTARDPDTVRGADVSVVRLSKLEGGRIPVRSLRVAPELAAEVKSPSDRWSDVIAKVGEYLNCGVAVVWVLDPDRKHVHVYTPDDEPSVLGIEDTLTAAALPEFEVAVAELFRGL